MESTTPCQELVSGTLRNRGVNLDAQLTQTIDDRLTLDEVVSTPVHIEVMNLLVECIGIGKNTVVGGFHVKTEDGTAESTHPGELVKVLQHNVEGLVTTP